MGVSEIIRRKQQDLIRAKIEGIIQCIQEGESIPEECSFEEYEIYMLKDMLIEAGLEEGKDYDHGEYSDKWESQYDMSEIRIVVDDIYIEWRSVGHCNCCPDVSFLEKLEPERRKLALDLKKIGIDIEIPQCSLAKKLTEWRAKKEESRQERQKVNEEDYEYDDDDYEAHTTPDEDDIHALDEDIKPQENLRQKFESNLLRDDVAEYYLSRTPGELEAEFGPEVARMVCFAQKNSHHCYDLWEHTIRTVEGVTSYGLTLEQFKKLRVAAFFHDIGKPDVSKFNEKTGQQVFYGHAMHSVDVARPILEKLGYSEQEIEQLSFFIGHHDDFISYKTKLEPFMKHHEFIRGIEPATVAEKVIENKFDFGAMGYDDDQIRAICYTLAHGRKPDFRTKKGPIVINVNMEEVQAQMDSGEYDSHYDASLEDYQMLLQLCKADAGAQSEVAMQNGRVVGSKAEKLENMSSIESSISEAYRVASEKSRSEFLTNIVSGATRKVTLRDQKDKAAQFTQDMQAKLPKENPSLGDN